MGFARGLLPFLSWYRVIHRFMPFFFFFSLYYYTAGITDWRKLRNVHVYANTAGVRELVSVGREIQEMKKKGFLLPLANGKWIANDYDNNAIHIWFKLHREKSILNLIEPKISYF